MNENKEHKITPPALHTVLLMLFSLFCSVLIWFYVTDYIGDETTAVFSNVKVVFDGESAMREGRELVITSCEPTSVRVTVKGNKRSLAGLAAADLTAVVDLTGISVSGNYALNCKLNYPAGTDSSRVSEVSFSPSTVSFYVDKLDRKTVPVAGVFHGNAAEGFSTEPLVFNPATVRISGPTQSLEKVKEAWIEVSREDVDKTVTYSSAYVLRDADGNVIEDGSIALEQDTVDVTLPIIAIKEVALNVNIIPGGGATDKNVKVSIEPATVTLSGDSETLAGLNNIVIEEIDLAEVDDILVATYPIILPNDTESLNGVREATVTVEISGLEKKYFSISENNLSYINCSEGYVAEIISESIDGVAVRGPADVLEKISPANIRAVADLTDYGTATGVLAVTAKIYINGTAEAGAFGEYRMYVRISKLGE